MSTNCAWSQLGFSLIKGKSEVTSVWFRELFRFVFKGKFKAIESCRLDRFSHYSLLPELKKNPTTKRTNKQTNLPKPNLLLQRASVSKGQTAAAVNIQVTDSGNRFLYHFTVLMSFLEFRLLG